MLYTRFSPVSRNTWEVSAPAESTKPFATITRRRGQYSAATTADHILNREELVSLLDFMQEHKQAIGPCNRTRKPRPNDSMDFLERLYSLEDPRG